MIKKIIFTSLACIASQNAYAYVDPGSASLFFQALIGGVMGGLFLLKVYWVKIKNALGFSSKKNNVNEQKELEDEKDTEKN